MESMTKFYSKFLDECKDKRILKIGQHLLTLRTNNIGCLLYETKCRNRHSVLPVVYFCVRDKFCWITIILTTFAHQGSLV